MAAIVFGVHGVGGPRPSTAQEALPAGAVATAAPAGVQAATTPVEVPNVTGKAFDEAELVLTTAGFQVSSRGETSSADGRPSVVVSQSPAPGARLAAGDQVTVAAAAGGSPQARPCVVVIDPGHQAKADLTPEPLGPGSPESKEKATVGAVGVATKRHESRVALDISVRLKTKLVAAGVKVIMTRTSDDVDVSNVQRAQIANEARADLLVRVHADAAASAEVRGVSVLYPAGNAWTAPIGASSRRAAAAVDAALVRATGARDLGTSGRCDLVGFNWSKVPTVLVEAGSLSNADEDRLLATPGYQDKVAAGVASGVLSFLGK